MRIYDNKYLSVTSIVGLRDPFDREGFEKWCKAVGKDPQLISSTSRILGEKVSEYLDNISKGFRPLTAPPVDNLEESLYSAVDNFVEKWTPIDTERIVKCKELNYAGRYDGVAENKESKERMLLDWKTYGAWNGKEYKRDSKKIKHVRWQLSMYSYAMDWKGGLGVVVFKNDGTWEIEELDFDQEMIGWVKENQKLILAEVENETKKSNKKV